MKISGANNSTNRKLYSIFKKYQNVGTMSLEDIVSFIKNGSTKGLQKRYRLALKEGPLDILKAIKDKFPAYTPSGFFHGERKIGEKLSYSNEINIDIDKVSTQGKLIDALSLQLAKDHNVLLSFISVGGDGISVTLKVNSPEEDHTLAFIQCQRYVEWNYQVKVDPTCKDITRLRYKPYDPKIYFNPDSSIFEVIPQEEYAKLEAAEQFTSRIEDYQEGSRNSFIYQFACNANREGIDQVYTLSYAQKYLVSDGISLKEIENTVKSGYSHNEEFAATEGRIGVVKPATAKIATLAKVYYPDRQMNTPVLPEEVAQKLPALIRSLNKVARNARERDILYLGMLCMLSSLFPSVLTYHGFKDVASNFYLLISANAAAGKGKLNLILEMAELVDAQLKQESQQSEQDGEDTPVLNGGLFIPANSSQAALMRRLGASMHNFLFDSEADMLTHTRKHEWSQLDPDLRKAFHHERISVARKKEEFEISHPKLSILLTGTPAQCKMLGESIENGLVSRLCVYLFKAPREWINQFEIPADEGIAWKTNLQQTVLDLFNYIRNNPFRFELTTFQQDRHTEYFGSEFLKLPEESPFEGALKRQGLIALRISMILTCIRRFEEQKTGSIEYCHDQDFECAMGITQVFIEHLKVFYDLLSETKPTWQDQLLQHLSHEFTSEQLIAACSARFGLKERRSYDLLGLLLSSGLIIKIGPGLYQKVQSKGNPVDE